MKDVDRNNHKPIDNIKIMTHGETYEIETKLAPVICKINHHKIDYDTIDEMPIYEQKKVEVTLEKITDLELFKSSKQKDGFEDFKIKLSDVGGFKIFRL